MNIYFLADVIVWRDDADITHFTPLTPVAVEWCAFHIKEPMVGTAYRVPRALDAGAHFMMMREDGLRVQTDRGISIVGRTANA